MGKSALLLVGVLALFIFLAVAMTQSLMIVQRIATVSGIVGPVWVKKPAEADFRPLVADTQVLAGTRIRTGPGGEVTLNWVDGTRVRLAPDSELQVRKCSLNTRTQATTTLFDLSAGKIWVRVLQLLGERSKFEIRTPTATAGVRGTVFSVAVDPTGKMEVEVFEGAVAISGAGRNLTANAGESAVVSNSTVATSALSKDDLREWQRMAGVVGPRLDLDSAGPLQVPRDTATVVISGVSEPGARVTVAGEVVALDRKNRFAHEVIVPPNTNEFEVVVRAEDARGGVTTVVQRVHRSK